MNHTDEGTVTKCKLMLMAGVLLVTGCATTTSILDNKQQTAVDTALARGKFDLNCPAAQGSVLSREFIQAPMAGPRMGVMGVDRAEYTIGVRGCEKQATYMVVCTEGTEGCIAGDRGR